MGKHEREVVRKVLCGVAACEEGTSSKFRWRSWLNDLNGTSY